ncbi:unnamed protein product [Sphagnum jensenii]|uniref:Uncharacterized protein n=1 Tax=Sphagnum jensenii TaxID=128206 RepID=A0ABP0WXE4_9BRYO
MFSVDFLELGGFRQIDFVQQKVSRRKKKKKKKGGKDLGRFGIQRIKLIHLSSDHTCKGKTTTTTYTCLWSQS